MAEDISTLLALRAAELSQDIYNALAKRLLKPSDLDGYRAAGDIAARLHLIHTYLGSLPPYWIESDVEQLCHTILRDLHAITRPTKELARSPFHLRLPYFAPPLKQKYPTDPESCLVSFLKTQTKNAQSLKNTCDSLLAKLTRHDNDAERLPEIALQHLDAPNSLNSLGDGVLDALQSIAECEPALHEVSATMPTSESDSQTVRHPARLCLHERQKSQNLASRNTVILVSAMDMALWQEFCLITQPGGPVDDNPQLLSRGGFCQILEREITASLFLSFQHGQGLFLLKESQILRQILQAGAGEPLTSVLRHYDLTPKDKVVLSCAIAQSYWQYYESELLMQIKWTSETIWFMPEEGSRGHKGQLPLCAYLSFPFGAPTNTKSEILNDYMLTHKCPRIFDIGVLLLEIGLAKPFRTAKRRDKVAQANLNHKIAIDQLNELEETSWDGFSNNKKYFDSVVKFCLSSENFIPPLKKQEQSQQADVITRRRFYKNVVLPLAWLAKKGFRTEAGDITYVNKKLDPNPHRGVYDIWGQPEPEALFHSAIVPKMWLRDLKKISEQVERKRRECAVTASVQVAILDTGLSRDFPAFKTRSTLIESITDEVDFVTPSAEIMTDTFGHGTFMARLIMECAPGVEILVARVAENTKDLENSRENIKKAILWAGQPGKADIILMSFGFPYDDQGIREAIEKVQRDRQEDIIFLASAGNSSSDHESFPARHPAVISVYATNCHGAFLRSNASSTSNGAAVLGTYGDDIPDFIREEFSTTYPEVCQRGSSVATAIMAGISATMLAYSTVLPSLVSLRGKAASPLNNVFQRLWTTKGMEEVLHRLVQQDPDHPRLKAVKPMWFWKSRPDDIKRYAAIYDTLSDLDRRLPKLTKTG